MRKLLWTDSGNPELENVLANEQILLPLVPHSEGYEFPQIEKYGGIVQEAMFESAGGRNDHESFHASAQRLFVIVLANAYGSPGSGPNSGGGIRRLEAAS
jgi:hypothetical protein